VYVATLEAGAEVIHRLADRRSAVVYVVAGSASVDREDVAEGDAARVDDQPELTIRAWQSSTVVVIEQPIESACLP
jgi:redox-sensitive bicupin YhaK (pirin superfamily)